MLGQLGPDAEDALPALTHALGDANAAVRTMAAESLKKIQGEKGLAPPPESGEPAAGEG